MLSTKWFLRKYREKTGLKASIPSKRIEMWINIIDFLVMPNIKTITKIVLDRNLGQLGTKIKQLTVSFNILYEIKVEVMQSNVSKGIQIADFVAGGARYLKMNSLCTIFLKSLVVSTSSCFPTL